jgi:hypothetical protein
VPVISYSGLSTGDNSSHVKKDTHVSFDCHAPGIPPPRGPARRLVTICVGATGGNESDASFADRTLSSSIGPGGQVTVTLRGVAQVTSGSTEGVESDTLTVRQGSPLDGVPGRYDADFDGEITIVELGAAASDHAKDNLGVTELGAVASAYAQS